MVNKVYSPQLYREGAYIWCRCDEKHADSHMMIRLNYVLEKEIFDKLTGGVLEEADYQKGMMATRYYDTQDEACADFSKAKS